MQLPIAIIASVVFLIFLVAIIKIFTRNAKETKAIQKKLDDYDDNFRRAYFATALIISVFKSVSVGRSEMKVDLRLEVRPPGEPYLATPSWMIDMADIGFVKQGDEIQVKIDANDSSVIYPTFANSKYWLWS
jgi:hypothetical protein